MAADHRSVGVMLGSGAGVDGARVDGVGVAGRGVGRAAIGAGQGWRGRNFSTRCLPQSVM